MADLTWPTDFAPVNAEFRLQTHTAVSESPFTRQRQILGLSAPRWVANLDLRGGRYTGAPEMDAFIIKLRGPQNRIALHDHRRPLGRGDHTSLTEFFADTYGDEVGFTDGTEFTDGTGFLVDFTGTPAVATAAAAGSTSVDLSGYSPNAVVFRAGDYLELPSKSLHMATETGTAEASGNVTVTFEPPLRATLAAGAAVVTTRPAAWFRLSDDEAGANPTDVQGTSNYRLSFVEDL